MTITQRTLNQIARDIQRGLPQGTTVVPFVSIQHTRLRYPIREDGFGVTPSKIARRLLRAIRLEHLTRFATLDRPSSGVLCFHETTTRFSMRAYEDFDIRRNEMTWWLDVIGDTGETA